MTSQRAIVVVLAAAMSVSCGPIGAGIGGDDATVSPLQVTPAEASDLDIFIAAIPTDAPPNLDREMALTLAAMPLSCLDRPHAAPRDRSTYLDEIVAARRPGYERNRAFYGCWDWHSAVNSTWTLVRIYKEFPELPIGGLMREKLNDHLSARALEGELEYFRTAGGFERPYGYAWLLNLYAELRTWDDPAAQLWADNVAPLASMFSARMIEFLADMERPSRSGAHSNTAFALAMMLDYTRAVDDIALQEAIVDASRRLFGNDFGCPTAYEPWGSDFLSPCLEEAALMADVLEPAEFAAWFERFMPAVTTPEFSPLTKPIDTSDAAEDEPSVDVDPAAPSDVDLSFEQAPGGEAGPDVAGEQAGETADGLSAEEAERERLEAATRALGGKSHLIGLAFIRGDAMNRIADALPRGDPRIPAYRRLAALHGAAGFDAMFDADYAGSHWIGTFALKYLLTER